jgi:hypothetical protein
MCSLIMEHLSTEDIAAKLAKLERYETYFRSSSKRYRDANKEAINAKRREVYHTVTKVDDTTREHINQKSREYYARKKAKQSTMALVEAK